MARGTRTPTGEPSVEDAPTTADIEAATVSPDDTAMLLARASTQIDRLQAKLAEAVAELYCVELMNRHRSANGRMLFTNGCSEATFITIRDSVLKQLRGEDA